MKDCCSFTVISLQLFKTQILPGYFCSFLFLSLLFSLESQDCLMSIAEVYIDLSTLELPKFFFFLKLAVVLMLLILLIDFKKLPAIYLCIYGKTHLCVNIFSRDLGLR